MQLLLVEDDSRLSEYMCEALGREGYSVHACASVEETEAFLSSQLHDPPRVVILDRMLGRNDGAKLIPKLKTQYPEAGILVLSSLDMPSEKARIIDAGADEYLSKPFSLDELAARLRLVVRRSVQSPVDVTIKGLGNLALDLKTQSVVAASTKLDLTRKEFQVLSLLLDNPGRVFNRFQILDRVWEVEHLGESNVVETTIKNLRRKLEDSGSTARIESKRNMGYWIET